MSAGVWEHTTVANLLRTGTSEELADGAEIFCGQSDPDAQFQLGLDLMLRGAESPNPDPPNKSNARSIVDLDKR